MRSGWSEGRLGVLAPMSEPLGQGSPRALQAAGVGRSRALRFRTCQARKGGLGRRRDPGPPLPADLGAELQPAPTARAQAPPRSGGPGEGGAALHVAGRGAAHVGSPRGPPLGCVYRRRARPRPRDPQGGFVSPTPQPGPPRASSPGLLTAASRALRPRLGLARLGSVRFGSPREEPPGLRLARGGASGSALIGQGAGVEERVPAAASAARRVPRGLK